VTDDFAPLFRLIENRTDEVSGRAATTISADLQKKLVKLGAGQCNEEERRELVALLEEQPDLIPALVKEIKNLRNLPKCQ
jgi:hypothetical protein